MRIEEMAARCHTTPGRIQAILAPILADLGTFCDSDGGEAASEVFRRSPGGRLMREALRETAAEEECRLKNK